MLNKPDKVGKKSRVNRTVISCDRCKARKTKCHKPDADGPCDYCRTTEQVCSIDVTKRRQKPFYFVSEEEYRLLRELCTRCYPEEDLDLPSLRRLAAETSNTSRRDVALRQDLSSSKAVDEAPGIHHSTGTPAKDPSTVPEYEEEEDIPLPEITNLHNDLGCLLLDAYGEYSTHPFLFRRFPSFDRSLTWSGYVGAESGVSFNGAVRSWMLRMSSRMKTTQEDSDKDKIPPLVKVTPPSTRSPLTPSTAPDGQPTSLLPPQAVVTSSAAQFFEQVHCLYWLYSTEDFYSRLDATYRGDVDASSQTGSWLCSLQSMVACASSEAGPDTEQQGPGWLDKAKALVPRVCDEADLDSIRALILLALALQSKGFTNSGYVHIGLAVRIAFSLGLHLDKYATKDGLVTRAYARRLWWTLFLFDQDLSLQLGKPCMTESAASAVWQPPLPSEHVVGPGSHTPHGYLEQAIRLAQITQDIRQRLYTGPIPDKQSLTQYHFTTATESLAEWSNNLPPHLHLSSSISPLHRRSISLLHLRYWSTIMLVTKPFLLCNLLRGHEIEPRKQSIFANFMTTCLSAAESSADILEGMVLHNVVSSLVVTDFYLALQTLQVFLAACGQFQGNIYQDRSRRCLKVLVAISVSGYPKHLLPETIFQVQQFGIVEGADDGNSSALSTAELQDAQIGGQQRLNRDNRGITSDLISDSWLNELNMTDVIINDELWGDIMDLSEIFPANSLT